MPVRFTGKVSDFLKIGVAAAARGDIDSVREILKQKPDWIHRVGSHGRTMLWEAAHRGKLEMVKYLVKRKADINACGSHYTPYFVDVSCYCIAAFKKRKSVAEYLLSKKAKVDIHTAAFLGDVDLVKKLLARSKRRLDLGHKQHVMGDPIKDKLDVVLRPAPWATPLCYALRGGDEDTVDFLIQSGAKIKGIEKQLFIAAAESYPMVKRLLENGADPKHAPRVIPDGSELWKLLDKYGVKMHVDELNEEFVYLCRGDRGGNPDDVQRLLDAGADVNFQDRKGKTALHRAAKAGFVDTVELLLEQGASVYLRDSKGETALFETVRSTIKDVSKLKQVAKRLLESGSDSEAMNLKEQSVRDVANSKTIGWFKDVCKET